MKPIRVEVEPLGEQRWARIDESLSARLDEGDESLPASRQENAKHSHRWAFAAAAAACIAAVVAGRSILVAPATGHPTRVVTTTSASHLTVGDSTLDVAPSSAITVDPSANGIVVVLERGRVECEVAPQDHAHPFVVRAGDYSVRVVGTHFAVSRDSDDAHGKTQATVDVTRGTVQVSGAGTMATLHAGDHWSSPAPATASEEEAPSATAPAQPVSRSPSLPAAPSDRPKAAASTTPQQEFETAASLEKSDPARALSMYEKLARGTGPWAENALFAEARLDADRGDRTTAHALLERYLQRYPDGVNAADARELLQRP